MKNTRKVVFSLVALFALTACGGNQNGSANESIFTLINPENTSMLTENCQKYIDDMREQEKGLGDDKYKITDLGGEAGVNIDEASSKRNIAMEDRVYLDKGDVNGQNRSMGQIPDRSDKSMGVDLKFNVKEGFTADEYKVLVSKDQNFSDAKELVAKNNEVNVNNLFVNTQYYWKVVAGNEESEVGTFTTGDYPRWITARSLTGEDGGRGIYNVRDMGGYMTDSGKRVKQGLVFRGGEITTMSSGGHYNTITPTAKRVFREDMGMVGGVELDLRGAGDISDGYKANGFAENGDIEYRQIAIKSYEETFTKNGSGQNNATEARANVAAIFELLNNADQKPVYYHCFGGADRTGTIGFLLNGVLGVSYTDLVIDFELTSYSSIDNEHIRCHIQGYQHSYDRWPSLINQIKTDTAGGYAYNQDLPLKKNLENFLTKACGVPETTINHIRDIMLED